MIFIAGNVPSLKNSKRIATYGPRCSKCGQFPYRKLIPSKNVEKWMKETEPQFIRNRKYFLKYLEGLEPPYKVCFSFIRKTKHRFDLTNAVEVVQDAMVKYNWLDDDNSNILIPSFGLPEYDKTKPGVFIEVLY